MLRKIAPAIVTNANNCKGEILPGRVPVRSCMILPPRQERRPQPPVSCKDCQRDSKNLDEGWSRKAKIRRVALASASTQCPIVAHSGHQPTDSSGLLAAEKRTCLISAYNVR
jgi:hypothetical protein